MGTHDIEYQGTTFKLTKSYSSFEDYKDDPNNIDLSEVPRIEQLMTEVKIGPEFSNWRDFVHQAFTVNFPGYGFGPGPDVKSTSRQFRVSLFRPPFATAIIQLYASIFGSGPAPTSYGRPSLLRSAMTKILVKS